MIEFYYNGHWVQGLGEWANPTLLFLKSGIQY